MVRGDTPAVVVDGLVGCAGTRSCFGGEWEEEEDSAGMLAVGNGCGLDCGLE